MKIIMKEGESYVDDLEVDEIDVCCTGIISALFEKSNPISINIDHRFRGKRKLNIYDAENLFSFCPFCGEEMVQDMNDRWYDNHPNMKAVEDDEPDWNSEPPSLEDEFTND